MLVAVTGASGLIGTMLTSALGDAGHRVRRLVRREASSPEEVRWDPAAGTIDPHALDGVHAVMNLAGSNIGARRWTERYKATIYDSRVDSTRLIAETIAATQEPPTLISANAVGYYGSRGDETLTEESEPGTGFFAEVCTAWEQATEPAREAGARVVTTRTGVVISDEGGILPKQALPFKLFVGGRISSGDQWLSWISDRDMIRALMWVLEADIAGPVNFSSPNPVTNREFTRALGEALHRPTLFPVPKFALEILFGSEMVSETLTTSQRVIPKELLESGFEFEEPEIGPALERIYRN